ncbi:translation initiation factor eIF2 alpha subunit [Perkinsela sp. CCAP 1560/4]|nr:translation initiation factor eIF2 alpha subunit [Perkinsela sp. CCAP 1560/4]KNH06687.1 translation initiation factor eIF2 alpha subunit [Perkinsela sp. CCAP 1560/4]|eukprot:KNH05061.1 translation initiation factor eIF2 alpha subunit [Perkinsela sp. CCAP 1560/4]
MEDYHSKRQFTSCRFYEKHLPDVDDLVMVKVKSVGDSSAYVSLIEYDNIEGMVPFTELSRRRIRSISKYIKVGSCEIMAVIRVDKDRGYVDLSKKRVSQSDYKECEGKFAHAKTVHGIMQSTVQKSRNFSLEELYKIIVWPLYTRFDSAYDGLKLAMGNAEKVITALGLQEQHLSMFDALLQEVSVRLKASAFRIRAEVELTLYTSEGIEGIKEVLAKAEKSGTEDSPIKIHIVAAPHYTVRTQSLDKALGISLVQNAVSMIITDITAKGGDCIIREGPHTVDDDEQSPTTHDAQASSSDEES